MQGTRDVIDMNAGQRALDELGVFLPPSLRQGLGELVARLERAGVGVEGSLAKLFAMGEAVIARGLDAAIQGSEALVACVYELGLMDALGDLNPFLRDGAEIGLQLGLNALKAMTPGDVAKLLGVLLIAAAAPNLLWINGAELVAIVVELLSKLWNLP